MCNADCVSLLALPRHRFAAHLQDLPAGSHPAPLRAARPCLAVAGLLLAVYCAVTVYSAAIRPYWYDELFTLTVCRLPGPRAMWDALQSGLDSNPPLFYVITRASTAMGGSSALALRFPAILGFGVMSVCLYLFVSRRLGCLAGLIAMLLPWVTDAYPFAYEARPYGIVLGAFSLALLCWQRAASGRRRRVALAGLTLSLAIALLSHCYAVMLFAPLMAGELVRSWRLGRIDAPMWIALILPAPAVISYLPLVRAAAPLLVNPWNKPGWSQILIFYKNLFQPALVPLVAILVLAGLAFLLRQTGAADVPEAPWLRLPLHEIVAVLTLLALPAFGVVLGKFFTGVFTTRYAICGILAPAILCAALADDRKPERRALGAAVVLLLSAWFVHRWMSSFAEGELPGGWSLRNPAQALERTLAGSREQGLPIAVTNGQLFLELAYYAPPRIASRLVYLTSPETALRYAGVDLHDRGLPIVSRWFPLKLNLQDYGAFSAAHRTFLVYGPFKDRAAWLPSKLIDDGATLEVQAGGNGGFLFRVVRREGRGIGDQARSLTDASPRFSSSRRAGRRSLQKGPAQASHLSGEKERPVSLEAACA